MRKTNIANGYQSTYSFLLSICMIILLCLPRLCTAHTLNLTNNNQSAIGQSITYFQEQGTQLNFHQAKQLFSRSNTTQEIELIQSDGKVLSFGIGAKPIWLNIIVNNTEQHNALRKLVLENAWLDKIDIYYLNGQKLKKHYQSGDSFAFQQRNVQDRFFVSDYHYPLGETELLIRIESLDPMVLPIYFLNVEEYQKRTEYNAYSYGLLYGAISALLLYNFVLFMALKNHRYFYYSLYLSSFLATNIAYTGHGYRWFWPECTTWQMWAPPVFMIMFNITGLLFAMHFLDLKRIHPRINKSLWYLCSIISVLLLLTIINNNHLLALIIAFSFMLPFSFIMVSLGLLSLRSNPLSGTYFLLGSIFAAVGSGITAFAVLGLIPFNLFSYRAVELGMLIDILLLALALAEVVRISEQKKNLAEEMARRDPLTNLGNRRSFYEHVAQMWPRIQNNKQNLSLILLDIDKFKKLNDNYGHAYGDTVLMHIADTINHSKRSRDIAARWGGEEFIILLPETNRETAMIIAQRIRLAIEQINLLLTGTNATVTASLGVATLQTEQSIDDLIKKADKQLYRAKQSGRNCVCASPEL